jgi:hypothetical protein
VLRRRGEEATRRRRNFKAMDNNNYGQGAVRLAASVTSSEDSGHGFGAWAEACSDLGVPTASSREHLGMAEACYFGGEERRSRGLVPWQKEGLDPMLKADQGRASVKPCRTPARCWAPPAPMGSSCRARTPGKLGFEGNMGRAALARLSARPARGVGWHGGMELGRRAPTMAGTSNSALWRGAGPA